MASPIFETRNPTPDSLGGMEIYPSGRGTFDISDDAIKRIEEGKNPTIGHDILLKQVEPEERERALDAFREFSSGTSRPTELMPEPETFDSDREDVHLEDKALQSYYDGRIDLAIEYFSRIKDKDAVYEQLRMVAKELSDSRDFNNAVKVAELIADKSQRDLELGKIELKRKKFAPTLTGNLDEGDKRAIEADFGAFQNSDEGRKVDLKIIRPKSEERGPKLSDKELADRFLSYQDADLPEELKAKMIEFNDGSESAKKYTTALRELIDVYGLETVEDLAEVIMDDCVGVLNKIGIEPNKFTQSKTWAIWDIAKQFHYFTHQNEADPEYSIANPIESTIKQNEIVDRHIGWELYSKTNKLEIVENVVRDAEARKRLVEYLNKSPKANGTLSSKDLAEIGEIISVSISNFDSIDNKPESVLEAKTVPPEVPPVVESGTLNPPKEPEVGVRNENIEANFEALREARDLYATAYAEWEYQTRNSTKLWKKTMFALGAIKPAPERLTLRTSTLEDAREEYLKARVACGKATSNTYKENYERITEEELLLQDAIQKARESREASDEENKKMADEMLPKGSVDNVMDKMADTSFGKMLRRANNVWLKVPGKTIVFSTTLVAGGTLFAGAGLGGAAFVGGMRVARVGASILGSQLTGMGLGKYFDKKNETADELNIREYAGSINEENFEEWEAKKLQQFENNRNIKRRQNAIRVGAMVSVGGATALSSGSILNSIFGTPSVEGVVGTVPEQQPTEKPVLESVNNFNNIVEPKATVLEASLDVTPSDFDSQIHALKADILSKYHGEQVPLEVQKNILDVPTDKLLEKFQLVDNAHNASAGNVGGRIAYENDKVVYEQAGIKRDLYDPNSEIGSKQFSKMVIGDPSIEIKPTVHEELLGDPVTTTDELKPTDPSFGTTEIQSQEPVLVDESKIDIPGESVKMGETILEQPFEGGKISLIHGTPTDPNHISMVLNGKEFAVGVVKNGITKFVIHPELKGGWFTTTVYERAYDVMQKKISAEAVRIK